MRNDYFGGTEEETLLEEASFNLRYLYSLSNRN